MKHLFIFLFFVFFYNAVQAQPGTLDKSYGEGGSFLSGSIHYNIISSAIQKDDKVIVGGADQTDQTGYGIYPYLLIRYNTDGSVDSSFGEKGKVVTSFDGYTQGNGWSSIKVLPDGKIIAAGHDFKFSGTDIGEGPPLSGDIVMARFNADGSYDASFGDKGIVITDFGKNEEVNAMALQPDGKIVLAGSSDDGFLYGPHMMVVRYNSDGALDKEFGSSGPGYSIYYNRAFNGPAYAVALQADNKIVIGGYYGVRFGYMIMRYLPDGRLDNSFGMNGFITATFADVSSDVLSVKSIAIDKQQNIVAGGTANLDNMVVARYKPDGSLDKTFNEGGIKTLHFGNLQSDLTTVFLQADGKLLLTGSVGGYIFYGGDIAVARLLPDGTYDSSFGKNGQTVTDLGNYEQTNRAVLQSDGKVVLTGNANKGDSIDYFITRYKGDDNNKQPMLVRIKRWMLHHGISWQVQQNKDVRYYAVQRSRDGIVYKEIAKLSNKQGVDKYEDAAMLAGSSYYRLAAIGWDGSRTYSNSILIDESAQVKVFPNPVRNNLQLQGLQSGKTSVSIVDLSGNVRSSSVAAGANYSINTSQLTPGNYLLKLQHNSTTTTQPFVKE